MSDNVHFEIHTSIETASDVLSNQGVKVKFNNLLIAVNAFQILIDLNIQQACLALIKIKGPWVYSLDVHLEVLTSFNHT